MTNFPQSTPGFSLTEITITQFLWNFFSLLEAQFKPEFTQQVKRVIEEFDKYLLTNNIIWAQWIRNAFVLGAQLEQHPNSWSGPFTDTLLSAMNQAIEEYFSFQDRPIPADEELGAKSRIKLYNHIINNAIK